MYSFLSINMEKTGENIYRLRENIGLSVRDLQKVFGFRTPQAIYKWQYGQALPSVDNLVILARILNTSIENILVVEDNEDVSFLGKNFPSHYSH